jgi:hypothetical protein
MNFLTMRYLGVPFCGGEPRFDDGLFGRVRDEVRRRDLVKFYEAHLAGAADGTNG